jgi:hypothetical protein
MSLRSEVADELRALRAAHEGFLRKEQVLEAARVKDTALWRDFDRRGLWDDTKAAEIARLDYARRIIVMVLLPADDDKTPRVREFTSVIRDRTTGGGFRALPDVLADEDLTANLLLTALMELRAFRRKYDVLRELAGVFEEVEKVEETVKRKPRKPKEERASV